MKHGTGNGLTDVDIRRAITHLWHLGDSDIVPPLPEYIFFHETRDAIADAVGKLTLGAFSPRSAVEILSPKSEFGYRIAHQLTAFDNLVFLSAALACGRAVESYRQPKESGRAFSYRFVEDSEYLIFDKSATFHNWLNHNLDKVGFKAKLRGVKWVVITDISDFYQRINTHRVENCLTHYGAPPKAAALAIKVIKKTRADQSFGLPVGTAASRLIAEALLIDTDKFIEEEGWDATRYVDDIRMFFADRDAGKVALQKLAQHLMITEGLSLNSSKTRIVSIRGFTSETHALIEDVFSREETKKLDYLFRISYGEDVDEEDDSNAEIDVDDILNRLRDALSEGSEVSKIRAILRALRVYTVSDLPAFLNEFADLFSLVPRDLALAIIASIDANYFFSDDDEDAKVVDILESLIDHPQFEGMAIVRIWVLEVFIRGTLNPTRPFLKRIEKLELTGLERRQLLILRGKIDDQAFFRALKTRFSELSDWEKPIAMWAASCLPQDEYQKWINFAKGQLNELYAKEYAEWLISNHGLLFQKLVAGKVPDTELD